MIQVVAWLWNDPSYRWNKQFRYTARHVNCMQHAVKEYLSLPHEFVCITDMPQGLNKDIRVIPLWDDYRNLGMCYMRLKAFSEEMREIIGPRFVWLDVDCAVVGNLDPLFSRTEPFIAWANIVPPTPYCGSLMMMDAGARRKVWDEFRPERRREAARYIGSDQAWVGHILGKSEPVWTHRDGVFNIGAVRRPSLPAHAKIVFFCGPHDVSQSKEQRFCPWMQQYWSRSAA